MPSFHSHALPKQLAPTPPDQCDTHQDETAGVLPHTRHLVPVGNLIASKSGCGMMEEFKQGQQFPQLPTSHLQSQGTFCPVSPSFKPLSTLLPRHADYAYAQHKTPQAASRPMEEKAVGGVAAHLDYEIEHMVDFVAEMAQGMYALYESRICLEDIDVCRSINPNFPVAPAFRKYVSQVLSSTRLPSTTILLALYYLATRITMLSGLGQYATGNARMYRMLVTSLLLGSKFLDDNTFQNRSWAEVSKISVAELNVLEMEWLIAIQWNMHVSPTDSQGLRVWLNHWEKWQFKRLKASMDPLGMTLSNYNIPTRRPLDTHRSPAPIHPASHNDKAFASVVAEYLQSQRPSCTTDQWPFLLSNAYSPPSAPETGPNTPEWYSSIGPARNFPEPQVHNVPESLKTFQKFSQATQNSGFAAPSISKFAPNGWTSHGVHCGCHFCVSHHDHFFLSSGYGPQSVVA